MHEADRSALVVAAWLHDIGYAPELRRIGLHQLDGAAYLSRLAVPARVICLVAHHSEARFEITLRGFGDELNRYEREEFWTSGALTYYDLTTGPAGRRMTFEERVTEVEGRYGEGEIVRALRQARPRLAAAMARTEERLARAGFPDRYAMTGCGQCSR